MEQTDIRALALKTIASRYLNQHLSNDDLITATDRLTHWLETGRLPESAEERNRREIGSAVRELAVPAPAREILRGVEAPEQPEMQRECYGITKMDNGITRVDFVPGDAALNPLSYAGDWQEEGPALHAVGVAKDEPF